ncbi:MAG: hypothetical protein ACPLIG_02145 [Candidatus Bathyarchaeales archaeon]
MKVAAALILASIIVTVLVGAAAALAYEQLTRHLFNSRIGIWNVAYCVLASRVSSIPS